MNEMTRESTLARVNDDSSKFLFIEKISKVKEQLLSLHRKFQQVRLQAATSISLSEETSQATRDSLSHPVGLTMGDDTVKDQANQHAPHSSVVQR